MKVKDLIEKLKGMDPEAMVITKSDNFEMNGADVPLSMVHQYETGSREVENFRDAFDGCSYSSVTYSITGGDLRVVYLRG
jgi:hypothetical protein